MPHSRDSKQGLYKFVWSSGGEFDTFPKIPKKVSITAFPPIPGRGETIVDHAFFHTATLKLCEQLDLNGTGTLE